MNVFHGLKGHIYNAIKIDPCWSTQQNIQLIHRFSMITELTTQTEDTDEPQNILTDVVTVYFSLDKEHNYTPINLNILEFCAH